MHNLSLALHFLTRCATYEVAPDQDLGFDLRRMPTAPKSGVVLRQVRATAALDRAAPALPSLRAVQHASVAAAPEPSSVSSMY